MRATAPAACVMTRRPRTACTQRANRRVTRDICDLWGAVAVFSIIKDVPRLLVLAGHFTHRSVSITVLAHQSPQVRFVAPNISPFAADNTWCQCGHIPFCLLSGSATFIPPSPAGGSVHRRAGRRPGARRHAAEGRRPLPGRRPPGRSGHDAEARCDATEPCPTLLLIAMITKTFFLT